MSFAVYSKGPKMIFLTSGLWNMITNNGKARRRFVSSDWAFLVARLKAESRLHWLFQMIGSLNQIAKLFREIWENNFCIKFSCNLLPWNQEIPWDSMLETATKSKNIFIKSFVQSSVVKELASQTSFLEFHELLKSNLHNQRENFPFLIAKTAVTQYANDLRRKSEVNVPNLNFASPITMETASVPSLRTLMPSQSVLIRSD